MRLARHPYLLLTLASFLWSANFVIGRAVHGTVPPVALAFCRWAGASLLVLVPAWPHLRHDWPAIRRAWPVLLLLAAVGIAAFNTLIYSGLQTTQALNALLMQSTMPVLIVAMSFFLFRDGVSGRQALGIALSLVGAATIILRGDPAALRTLTVNHGDLLVMIAVICYAAYSALLRLRPAIHPLSFVAVTFVAGTVMLVPFLLGEIRAGHTLQPNLTTFLAVGYVAIFPSIVAYLCFNRGVELVGANRAGLFIHLMPVFGSLMAIVFLGEAFRWFHGTGIVLIAAGIFLATRR